MAVVRDMTAGGVTGSAERSSSSLFRQYRFLVCLLMMLSVFCTISMRIDLGIAMVCMINSSAVRAAQELETSREANNPASSVSSSSSAILMDPCFLPPLETPAPPVIDSCPASPSSPPSSNNHQSTSYGGNTTTSTDAGAAAAAAAAAGYHGTFEWNEKQQAQLFTAAGYGMLASVWWSGFLADRVGAKYPILLCLLTSSIGSLAGPLLVMGSYYAFFASRFVMGFGEGMLFPSLGSVGARWFPPAEYSTMAGLYSMGVQFADVVVLSVSSRLCALDEVLGGWPLIFIFFGSLGLVCCVLWLVFFSSSPTTNRWISIDEKEHIKMATMPRLAAARARKGGVSTVPWGKIMCSLPFNAVVFASCTLFFTVVIMQSYLPTYVRDVLRLNLKQNGLFSAVPFSFVLLTKMVAGPVADSLKKRGVVSSTTGVRLFQGVANMSIGIGLLTLGLAVDCNRPVVALCALCAYGFGNGVQVAGFITSLMCLGPAYAGIIVSLNTTIATVLGALTAPSFVGYFNKHGSLEEWRFIWCFVGTLNFASALFFIAFGSGDDQGWSGDAVGKVSNKQGGAAGTTAANLDEQPRRASLISNL